MSDASHEVPESGQVGTAIGGVTACIIGGAAGYVAGASLGGGVYDWAEGTTFLQVPEVA